MRVRIKKWKTQKSSLRNIKVPWPLVEKKASGIWKDRDFTRSSIRKGREICHLGLWKDPKGRTDEF